MTDTRKKIKILSQELRRLKKIENIERHLDTVERALRFGEQVIDRGWAILRVEISMREVSIVCLMMTKDELEDRRLLEFLQDSPYRIKEFKFR